MRVAVHVSRLLSFCLAALAVACSAPSNDPAPDGSVPTSATGGRPTAPGTGGATGGASSSPSSSTTAYRDLPCDVARVLETRCGDCHGESPRFGAPMSLVRASDFARKALDGARTVGQAVIARINDDAHPMPQSPAPRLTTAETSVLSTWINAGAKAAACTSAGTGTTTPAPDAGATASDPADPDVTCYDVAARASAGSAAKYAVPNTPDLYHCFSYAPPWGSDKVHLVSWRPLIDNDKVIHHWILYNENQAVTDGANSDCSGAHPSAQMVAGWAPGGQGGLMPPDVGQDVSGPGFTLEVHYNNASSTSQPDASGVRLCVTKKLRKNEAGIHWLGTERILLPAGGKATGTCKPSAQGPVTILTSTPHMHLQGRHLTTVIKRAGGGTDMLLDKPFDFATQISYATPQTIMPGDTLTTTCEYGGAAFYGEGTKQEMCYNFVLAYPNGGLASGSALRKNGCTGL